MNSVYCYCIIRAFHSKISMLYSSYITYSKEQYKSMHKYWIICTSCTTQALNWIQTDKLKVMKMSCCDEVFSWSTLMLCHEWCLCGWLSSRIPSVFSCIILTGWPPHHHFPVNLPAWQSFTKGPGNEVGLSAFNVCHTGSCQLHRQWPFAMITVTGLFTCRR